ncbi:MAG: mannitol dehydrogenase family protein [Lactobacillaceae bacterium]|jgi:fructuronate reductase|nr:mannitol dehydrogenase family protein [Lactobacillaceae bacterium]
MTKWIHFGGGNLFRAFHAEIAHHISEPVVVAETWDEEVVEKIYNQYDGQIVNVTLKGNGQLETELLTAVSKAYYVSKDNESGQAGFDEVKRIFEDAALQFATITITEKGYKPLPNGADSPSIVLYTELLLARFEKGGAPIAMVSTDNFSRNGDVLKNAVLVVANKWLEAGTVSADFLAYLQDDTKVSFPWSMIDRITPNPAESVREQLVESNVAAKYGFNNTDLDILHTEKRTNVALFANTEETHYLCIEDNFPNGRPALEEGGVILTDRLTVEKIDEMKVCTCLNPLHTALAIYGTILEFPSISAMTKDAQMMALIKEIGYNEGMKVVVDPKVINPKEFIDAVINDRLPNPYIPDTPQRIATDTSQKLPIRFGKNISLYAAGEAAPLTAADLTFIPLALAGWVRYLLGVNEAGETITLSPDPKLEASQAIVKDLTLGWSGSAEELHAILQPLLSDETIFAQDLYAVGLGEKVEGYVAELIAGPGAVRATLKKYLNV